MIDLLLIPYTDCISGTVSVDIKMVSDEPVWVHAVDMAFGWDSRKLRLVGCDHENDTADFTVAGVPGLNIPLIPWDIYGLNDDLQDGVGYFMWLAPLTGAANAQYIENDVIATLRFERVTDSKTSVDVLPESDGLVTRIYAGPVPGVDLLGGTANAKVAGCGIPPLLMLP